MICALDLYHDLCALMVLCDVDSLAQIQGVRRD